ncbi:uncharacterized protein PHALS_03094 [Plasmopara halstedii]|uniref:Uncharacterized protein n=1 Tax=Plasmopara halstedii TaxID=4781 RepID=A0A0P1A8B5_PLAHL|nr:uncharacterized protein PHALS_03094 [Plasmopara halstedii]CEG36546.1 hypothetical protein PHALS_03094 [Plasmopara halstedii]|eukprot:XP_024572915.1 hypothetical protein PHALS_03094 [Plasmopara halstedii]
MSGITWVDLYFMEVVVTGTRANRKIVDGLCPSTADNHKQFDSMKCSESPRSDVQYCVILRPWEVWTVRRSTQDAVFVYGNALFVRLPNENWHEH